ncbi:uncharacterized protein LOC143025675 [Oratosquilla oratoria]|uniref:uncharacterized protein LOC143025675 n=1 Tax=Oratosquilla oratoria TaxID=337810 RepID=UPI003F76ADD4
MYEELETKEGQKKIYKIAKERNRATKDLTLVKQIKDKNGKILTDPDKIWMQWKEYYEELLNQENPRGTGVGMEGEVDPIREAELMIEFREVRLWRSMRSKGVKEKYVRMTQDMYRDARTRVRSAAGTTEAFSVSAGFHQGSALSPYLFNLLIDVLVEKVTK